MFTIYESFFDVKLKSVPLSQAWHSDILCIQLFNKNEKVLFGTIFLDLFPREGKFSHAAQCDIIPAFKNDDGSIHPGAVLVMANFPKPMNDIPALLKHSDVKTFFHEFGHVMYNIFNKNDFCIFSGTNVEKDLIHLQIL